MPKLGLGRKRFIRAACICGLIAILPVASCLMTRPNILREAAIRWAFNNVGEIDSSSILPSVLQRSGDARDTELLKSGLFVESPLCTECMAKARTLLQHAFEMGNLEAGLRLSFYASLTPGPTSNATLVRYAEKAVAEGDYNGLISIAGSNDIDGALRLLQPATVAKLKTLTSARNAQAQYLAGIYVLSVPGGDADHGLDLLESASKGGLSVAALQRIMLGHGLDHYVRSPRTSLETWLEVLFFPSDEIHIGFADYAYIFSSAGRAALQEAVLEGEYYGITRCSTLLAEICFKKQFQNQVLWHASWAVAQHQKNGYTWILAACEKNGDTEKVREAVRLGVASGSWRCALAQKQFQNHPASIQGVEHILNSDYAEFVNTLNPIPAGPRPVHIDMDELEELLFVSRSRMKSSLDIAFTVATSGRPLNIEIKGSDDEIVQDRVRNEVRKWRFEPLVKDGAVRPAVVHIPVEVTSGVTP